MLKLPKVTILSVNCKDPEESIKALRYSCKDIQFKEAILLTDSLIYVDGITTINIPKLSTIHEYSDFMLRLYEYIDSPYVLVIQPDGYVLNANMWDDAYLNYDYIGAEWPSEQSWIDCQQAKDWMTGKWNSIGNGGFSLRSRKFMELSATFTSCQGYNEDNYLAIIKYKFMKQWGVKFAPSEIASKFSAENNMEDWKTQKHHDPNSTFGFHGWNFSNSKELIGLKG